MKATLIQIIKAAQDWLPVYGDFLLVPEAYDADFIAEVERDARLQFDRLVRAKRALHRRYGVIAV